MNRQYYFKKYFSHRFILDAETLKDIHRTLDMFLEQEDLGIAIEYHVFTNDGNTYITSDTEEVLSEPNSKQSRISLLLVRIGEERASISEAQKPVFIECRFSPARTVFSTRCKVEIQDYRPGKSQKQLAKDLCQLFERTQREATLAEIKFPALLTRALPPNVTFFAILLMLRNYPSLSGVKLGEIGVLDAPFYILGILLLYGACFIAWQVIKLPTVIEKKFPTTGVFLWGAEEQDYRNRLALNERITWGIIVSLFVGVVASLVAAALTSIAL